jgi:hypothetical protein
VIRKCANSKCNTEFRYSHEGRLFPFEIKSSEEPCRDVPAVIYDKKPGRATVYFWLCDLCCRRLTLRFSVRSGVSLTPRPAGQNPDRRTISQANATADPERLRRRYS